MSLIEDVQYKYLSRDVKDVMTMEEKLCSTLFSKGSVLTIILLDAGRFSSSCVLHQHECSQLTRDRLLLPPRMPKFSSVSNSRIARRAIVWELPNGMALPYKVR